MVVDEAHGYCNILVDKCRSIASLCAQYRWLLSGTMFSEPHPANILGFYTLMNNKDTPRDLVTMTSVMRRNFQGLRSSLVIRDSTGMEKPVYQIRHELVQQPMTEEEIKIYEMIKRVLNRINTYMKLANIHQDNEGRRRYASYLLAMITYLRQILIAPMIVLASVAVDVCKIQDRSELSSIIKAELDDMGLGPWLESPDSLYSSRMCSVMKKLKECGDAGTHRIILFSAFRTSLRLLAALVEETYPGEWKLFTLESGSSIPKRTALLKEFSECPKGILLLTYKTGSEGLNLQEADTVFIMDALWNASSGEQAIARVARRGQKSSTVNVLTFMSNTGIEKAMLEKHIKKIEIAEELMNGSSTKHYHTMKVKQIIQMVLEEDTSSLYHRLVEKSSENKTSPLPPLPQNPTLKIEEEDEVYCF
jgi:SNF2 family DNA or RNA helicase